MRIVFRHLPNFVLRMLRRWPIQFASKASIYKVRILQFFCCVWCLIRVRVHDTRTTFYILDITSIYMSVSVSCSMSVLHRYSYAYCCMVLKTSCYNYKDPPYKGQNWCHNAHKMYFSKSKDQRASPAF